MSAWAKTATELHAMDARADGAQREILLARQHVLIRRRLGGIEMRLDVPSGAFRGVVLSLGETASGGAFYRISLLHRDPDLCVTLQEALDDCDIVADWHEWSKFFGLPNLVEREPGQFDGESKALGAVILGRGPKLRRRGATLSKRRPRILQRRKTGDMSRSSRVFLGERIIIAYE